MADFPYLANAASIKQLVSKIHGVGKPTKVTQKWLESIGFKSKDDRKLIQILKVLAFIDKKGFTIGPQLLKRMTKILAHVNES